jgi:hypothetical protein
VVIGLAWACGGSKKSEASGPGQGMVGEGHDMGGGGGGGGAEAGSADAGAVTSGTADAGTPAQNAPVTFVVSNQASQELAFSLNKGWGVNFSFLMGKPPKAKWFV